MRGRSLPRRATLALVLAIAMVAAVLPGGTAFAEGVERVSGANRIETAVAISQQWFEPGVDVAFVARDNDFPDALAGGPMAALLGAPILLTRTASLPQETADELARLDTGRIVVLGGTLAVSDAVLAQLRAYTSGDVDRVSGPERFATAAAIASEGFDASVPVVFVATGINFPDALVGGLAAAREGAPILLVTSQTIPDATVQALEALAPQEIVVLGGTAVVSDAVFQALGAYAATVTRVSGPERVATAVRVSQRAFPEGADDVLIATGGDFPDSLAAVPAAFGLGAPLLLVGPRLTPELEAELERLRPYRIWIVGGTAAVSAEVAAALSAFVVEHRLEVEAAGQGTVSVDPDRDTYADGEQVTLTAQAAAGWSFAGWAGNLSGTANPATLVMDGDKQVTATFTQDPPPPAFTLTTSTVGSGSITRDPNQAVFTAGEVVELAAVPQAGWSFAGWGGDLSGTANPATLVMDSDKQVTATFTQDPPPPEFTLTADTDGDGTVDLDPPGGTYDDGTVVTLEAVPDPGWTFAGWSGDLSGTANPETIVMDADKSVTATFTLIPPDEFTLTVDTDGDGTVDLDPPGGTYDDGTVVTLEAVPDPGWTFTGWSGDLSGDTNPETIVMDADKSVTATFTEDPVAECQPLDIPSTPEVFASDAFERNNLDVQRWRIVDPKDDGHVRMVNHTLELEVPGGATHNPGPTNESLRVLRPIADEDFEIEVKFDSVPEDPVQIQGFIVQESPGTFMRFEFHQLSDTAMRVYMAGVGGVSGELSTNVIALDWQNSMWMQVVRNGNEWTLRYSTTGDAPWGSLGPLTAELEATEAGLYVGNFHTTPTSTPGYTAVVDYVLLNGAAADPEPGEDELQPYVYWHGTSGGDGEITVEWRSDEPTEGTITYWPSDDEDDKQDHVVSGFAYEHSETIGGLDAGTEYVLELCASDAEGNTSLWDLGSETTDS